MAQSRLSPARSVLTCLVCGLVVLAILIATIVALVEAGPGHRSTTINVPAAGARHAWTQPGPIGPDAHAYQERHGPCHALVETMTNVAPAITAAFAQAIP